LILNLGSQSIKWKLFDKSVKGLKLIRENKRNIFISKNYEKILEDEMKSLASYKKDIRKVGHRVVLGGDKLRKPIRIDDKVLEEIRKYNKIAPLHNPYNVLGIKTAKKFFSKAEQIAVFDTEFFANLPEKAFVYPLPLKITEKYGFKRFGFHGISHEYVAKEGAKIINKRFNSLKIITCHLGGGASITAIKNGKAIDTSLGYSPMEGPMMMTRSGSIDPGIIFELLNDFSSEKVKHILNYESGLKGISGQKDMLSVLRRVRKGDKKAKLAFDIFCYQIRKYIGAYFGILGGCDLLVFTGSIGAGDPKTRNTICKDLNILKNTKVLAIKTDEELAIAKKV
ncbi:MAG: acetate/propionate family kinase, partial [Candidatus Nealsonbacteria bacterium]|nr:acetate/propionate family kinase [Candidatus Nealsonbacteria bacterium]